MSKDFEQLPHTADIKIRVYGATLAELFRHAVMGMFQSIKPRVADAREKDDRIIVDTLPITHDVVVDAGDRDALLVDFLSEALYLSDVHNEAYLDADVHEMSDTNIRATLKGVKVQGFEVVEIKAVTYHELTIKEIDGTFMTDIVFDI